MPCDTSRLQYVTIGIYIIMNETRRDGNETIQYDISYIMLYFAVLCYGMSCYVIHSIPIYSVKFHSLMFRGFLYRILSVCSTILYSL